jgi:hypothetical protein
VPTADNFPEERFLPWPFLEQFRNYCGLIKIARCGFPWEKTTKRAATSVDTNCETALWCGNRWSRREFVH